MRAKELLGACFVVFSALLVWPLLSIPNRLALVAGLPALVLYLFAVWAALVLYLFAVWAALVAVLWLGARASAGDEPP